MKKYTVQKNQSYKHGHAGRNNQSPTYTSWYAMIRRCYNKNNLDYHHYGGRGIKVFPKWRKNFVNFLNDVGERPDGTTLDRIDVNKGYFPNNVRWVNRKFQTRNRRRSLMGKDYLVNGEKLKAFEIQEKYKIKKCTFYARIYYGIPLVNQSEIDNLKTYE